MANPPVRYSGIGGFARPADVGSGGDQLMAARLRTAAEELTQQVATMAAHPSMQPYVDAAAVDGVELCTKIPSDDQRD